MMTKAQRFSGWCRRYVAVMEGSKLLSQAGAFVIVVLASVEAARTVMGVAAAETVAWKVVFDATVSPTVFIVAFGLRFYVLSRKLSPVKLLVSWWISALAAVACLELYGPSGDVIYDLFSSFPLEMSGAVFLLLGSARFLITATLALSDEFDPDRRR